MMNNFIKYLKIIIKSIFHQIMAVTVGCVSKKISRKGIMGYFENKSCVILGPNSELSDELIKIIKNSDVCIFLNKGYRSNLFKQVIKLNSNCVLFHCLHPSETIGGGRLNKIYLRFIGIRDIFYTLIVPESIENIKLFHNSNFGFIKLHIISDNEYSQITQGLDNFVPNMGSSAIFLIAMEKNVKLHVSGITFFRTNYLQGYHQHLNNTSQLIAQVEKYGSHNPDLDFIKFKKFVKEYNISVDSILEEIIKQEYYPLFYVKENN